jgi:histidine ammonia-lyase
MQIWRRLQKNLVMSHACGAGEEVPQHLVKLMLFLKIQGLSYGNSGVQLETVQSVWLTFLITIFCLWFTSRDPWVLRAIWRLWHTFACPCWALGEVYYKGARKQAC